MKDTIKKSLIKKSLDQSLWYDERIISSKQLAKEWIYIDKATIEWKKQELELIKKKKWESKLLYLFWFNPLI